MDEERKNNYIVLRNGMYKVRQNINQAIESYNNLKIELKKALLINNNIIFNEEFDKNEQELNNIKNRIDSTITTINSKI